MSRKCEFNDENLKACSENDWDCAFCDHMKDEKYIDIENKFKNKEDFINYCLKNNICPDEYGLKGFEDFSECESNLDFCKMCIESSIKDIHDIINEIKSLGKR